MGLPVSNRKLQTFSTVTKLNTIHLGVLLYEASNYDWTNGPKSSETGCSGDLMTRKNFLKMIAGQY